MKQYILFTLVIVTCSAFCLLEKSPRPAAEDHSYSGETMEKIRQVENNITGFAILNDEKPQTITERMEKYNVKGVSIAVIENYKVAWAKGYGWADEEEKIPVTTETLFQPGSISKSLNAVGILKLAQEKKVDLYTDVNTYLTSWKFPYDTVSHGKKITLAQILSHTAGLSTIGFRGYNLDASVPDAVQILDGADPAVTTSRIRGGILLWIPPVRSIFEPGLQFSYSGGGTTVSQVVLTDVTGESYGQWMYRNVLKPLGMRNSTFAQRPGKSKAALYASGYYRDGARVLNRYHDNPMQAAAGLWTTPTELCNYIIDMQLAYKGKPSKVLDSQMVRLHLTPYNNGPTSLGAFIDDRNGEKYFQHSAANDGFSGQYYAGLDEGNGVVIFMNNEDGTLIYEIMNSIARVYNWKNVYREPGRKVKAEITIADSIFSRYEGIYLYENTWAGIGKRNNDFQFCTMGMYVNMHFSSPLEFFNAEFSSVKAFICDSSGQVKGYTRFVDEKEYPRAMKVVNPDTLQLSSDVLTEIGWYLFDNKKYGEAIPYFRRGVQLYPDDFNLRMSLAHAFLFNGEYEQALSIHKAHINDSLSPVLTWKKFLVNDFIYFTEYQYDVSRFGPLLKDLDIPKPRGY